MLKQNKGKRALSMVLLLTMLFSLFVVDVSAITETISDGKSKTVTIKMDEKFSIMQKTAGNKLNGYSWIYTTDTGNPKYNQTIVWVAASHIRY